MNIIDAIIVWRIFRGDSILVRNKIWARWEKAEAVYSEAVGFGLRWPLENRLIHLLVERRPGEAREFFEQGLVHPDAKIVGYSLVGIAALDRSLLEKISIPKSYRKVTWYFGCIGTECSLEQFKASCLA